MNKLTGKKAAKTRGKAGTSKASAADKRKAFVDAYLSNGGNATQAAIDAGYSEGGASKAGYRLSKDVSVLSAIGQRQDALAKAYSLTTEDIIKSISQELHFDPAKLFNDDGSVKEITSLDEDTRKALVSVELVQLGSLESPVFVRKVKWALRSTARDQAMKHLGMFERDNRQRTDPLRDLLAALSGNVLGVGNNINDEEE